MSKGKIRTSVDINPNIFEAFKTECITYRFNAQKLVERSMFLYLTDETFREQLHNQLDTELK